MCHFKCWFYELQHVYWMHATPINYWLNHLENSNSNYISLNLHTENNWIHGTKNSYFKTSVTKKRCVALEYCWWNLWMDHCSFCMEMKLTFVDLSNGQKRFMCNKMDLKRFSMPLSIIQLLGLTTMKPNYFFKFPLSAFR